ncbi:MAG: DUF6534 domain-containing protein [Chloroflexia bacterium]
MRSQPVDMTADANIEEIVAHTPGEGAAKGDVQIYALSREGRRTAIILLLGVVSIWIFALWSLITILDDGISGVEWVSTFLMLGILVVAPMVAWTLLEEVNSRISVSDAGVRYRSLGGIDLAYNWDDLTGFQQAGQRGKVARFFLGDKEEQPYVEAGTDDDIEEEPNTELLRVRDGHGPQIGNPVVGFLHKQAHGAAVPIYGGIENREELLGEIRARLH